MTLRHLKIFAAVCEARNMTKAAVTLFISQSAVSQAIADLETHYGTKLFERLTKKLYLTESGEKLFSYARHIISMLEEAETSIHSLTDKGLIRIGASVTVGTAVLPEIVTTFRQTAPAIRITVVEDNTAVIESLILNNEIDIGLVEGEISSPDIVVSPFMRDELVLISGQRHPFSKKPVVTSEELKDQDFIIREKGSGTRKLFETQMAANGIQWSASWVCNNSDTIKKAVISNIGISVISKRSVQDELRNHQIFVSNIEGIEFVRYFKIICHKNKYMSESMLHLIESIHNRDSFSVWN